MVNPVMVSDLEARWRPLTAAETGVAQALLDDAWMILLTRADAIEARITDGTLPAELVRAVESAMVLRVLRNPDGKVSETIDDYTYRRADPVSAGALYVSADELALLGGSGPRLTGSAKLVAYG